jgi:hypothetical protein
VEVVRRCGDVVVVVATVSGSLVVVIGDEV